ncbi:PP2C family protein-serine/threonine phosphatase [Streptosporangium pseudovulgare]|uniref:PPM-type phosphatase domain-containing protein n=1 Tax=Streptosporangium pseudovulgare TaxID=35765 RepID=A0ABQ2R5R7_9ACTN|nr:PP2C family protein-serine/threonine phosphatase [Streptosporangium pseudovulgare]GGQ15266.1 hypothetical protein GCM10010140_51840 [Streptosporangium pseudovulgare]
MTGSAPLTTTDTTRRPREEPDEHLAVEHHLLSVRLAQAERLGDLGWAEWNLQTGETIWSDRVYAIFGRDPGEGPIRLADLASHVETGDRAGLDRLLRSVVHRAEPGETEFRIRRRGEIRNLRAALDPVAAGGRTAVHGVIQDVTGHRRAEHGITEARRRLGELLGRATRERRQSEALCEALLPGPASPSGLPGARIETRYHPAGAEDGLGGDWHDAVPLPDGRILLAVGDVSGHGLPAAAEMTVLRHALAALAMTGEPVGRLLSWLNHLVTHRMAEATATAVAGHLDPATGVFTWSQAGHPAPVLVRDGTAVQLAPPDGVLLGATLTEPYASAEIRLREDDLLLLFTDGLVERRDRDIDDGVALLLEVAAGLSGLRGAGLAAGLDRLVEAVGGPNPEDDVCVLAFAPAG